MSDFKSRLSNLTPKQLILLADSLNTRLEEAGRTATEPLAVIGLGCRFPGGADTPDLFWDLLVNGRQGIREVPPDRWDIDAYFDPDPDKPGKMNTRWGGFLEQIDQFDADFFGISPREAATMDPQQRLLLEVAWETLEHAGVNPRDLAGSPTGVYVGICNSDYFHMLLREGPTNIDAYLATGSAHSIASGRISYILGLEGPSLSVDTACSSSLVAVHLACQSLRLGECRLALAGGVNLILSPEMTIALSKARMMSPDGRCKTFDQGGRRLCAGRGLRDGGPETAVRRSVGRGPHHCPDSWDLLPIRTGGAAELPPRTGLPRRPLSARRFAMPVWSRLPSAISKRTGPAPPSETRLKWVRWPKCLERTAAVRARSWSARSKRISAMPNRPPALPA